MTTETKTHCCGANCGVEITNENYGVSKRVKGITFVWCDKCEAKHE